MRGVGCRRHVAARNLVLALGACFDAGELVLDGVLDRLVIAKLEVQERMVLDGAPVAAKQGVGADEVDGPGDPAPVALGHHQQDTIAHLLAHQRIEFARQIRPAPFARAGFHVELEEGVPHAFGEIGAGQPMHTDPRRQRVRPLATDGLSLAGGERRKKRLEARVTGVLPVELLVRTLEVAACAEEFPFRFGREGDVNRGAAGTPTHVRERIGEMRAHGIGLRARSREQPAACRGRGSSASSPRASSSTRSATRRSRSSQSRALRPGRSSRSTSADTCSATS